MRATIAVLALAGLMLTACGPKAAEKRAAKDQATANAAIAKGFVPPTSNDTAAPQPLNVYVGKLPGQQVDGVDFFDRTQVHEAIADAIPDLRLRRLVGTPQGPARPIFADGSRVAASGCEADKCDAHNWTVFVDTRNGTGEVCYHDAVKMGDRSRWYVENKPRTQPGGCPSGPGSA